MSPLRKGTTGMGRDVGVQCGGISDIAESVGRKGHRETRSKPVEPSPPARSPRCHHARGSMPGRERGQPGGGDETGGANRQTATGSAGPPLTGPRAAAERGVQAQKGQWRSPGPRTWGPDSSLRGQTRGRNGPLPNREGKFTDRFELRAGTGGGGDG